MGREMQILSLGALNINKTSTKMVSGPSLGLSGASVKGTLRGTHGREPLSLGSLEPQGRESLFMGPPCLGPPLGFPIQGINTKHGLAARAAGCTTRPRPNRG